jgi:hypothetical protein
LYPGKRKKESKNPWEGVKKKRRVASRKEIFDQINTLEKKGEANAYKNQKKAQQEGFYPD